jgi:hypothetical protein
MLRMGMKPVFVFDGGRAPQKDATNEDRQARRAIRYDAYENGVEGAEGSAASTRNLRASVSITDEMVSRAVCHAACPPATRATTKSDGSLERFAFLSLGRSHAHDRIRDQKSATKVPSRAEQWERREPH